MANESDTNLGIANLNFPKYPSMHFLHLRAYVYRSKAKYDTILHYYTCKFKWTNLCTKLINQMFNDT